MRNNFCCRQMVANSSLAHALIGKTVATFPVHALTSHAHAECRHAAQSFALPKFSATQHDTYDSMGRERLPPIVVFWEEGASEGF
jgi:hypothetical protein